MSKKNTVPQQKRYMNSSGMMTNANPEAGSPNGMPFDKPEVEQYFTDKFPTAAEERESMTDVPDDWMARYERDERVEHSRFLHRPVTGRK